MRIKRSTDRLPEHLKAYVVKQPEDLYTAMDQAAWRYIMKVSQEFFKVHAHKKYSDGLTETGITIDRIPNIDEMDLCLSQFAWGAVPVSGFIPPGVFMELLSLGILPIAADMRKVDNIAYTPTPDIVHEAAGHAPIISDPEYARFLHDCGEIARKCILTQKDMDQYEAILNLSNVKEDPRSTDSEIEEATKNLKKAIDANDFVSEAVQFGRMIWWTVEYGLVGDMAHPQIYGAGLLSSVGESHSCLSPQVKKIPFSLDCINYSYDITEPQPQLFVTPDFKTLSEIALQFSRTLAYQRGGVEGLKKAEQAAYPTTVVLDSNIQISGILKEFSLDSRGNISYMRWKGPVQLSYEDTELPGQGVDYHQEGFGAPLGKLKGQHFSVLKQDTDVVLAFESGVQVTGHLFQVIKKKDKPILLRFKNCTVKNSVTNELLFDPQWGVFDLACGEKVASVFGGAADRPKYKNSQLKEYKTRIPVSNVSFSDPKLCRLYEDIRAVREGQKKKEELIKTQQALKADYPLDWLARLEILELLPLGEPRALEIIEEIKKIKIEKPETEELIHRGLKVFSPQN